MDNIPILLLRLEGALQSWGERAKWNQRDSAFIPTKSGVIGLIACALGLSREDDRIISLSRNLCFAVRADRAGHILDDFHTVRGIIGTAEGKWRGLKGEETTIVTNRQYLQDASFLVALNGEQVTLEACAAALRDPHWQVFLGRKSCVPSRPIFEKLTFDYSSVEEAFARYPVAQRCSSFSLVYQSEGGDMLRRDELDSAIDRRFELRRVTQRTVEVEHVSV